MPKDIQEQIRVNIKSTVNSADIRHETRNGRAKIIIPSVTLPDDIVMNRKKYPASVIASSFAGINDTQVPFGHPMVGGEFISATDPEGLNLSFFGAHNENARQVMGEDGRNRVFVDKVIDVARAQESENGRRVLAAISNKEPIHTSIAVYCAEDRVDGFDDHDFVVSAMFFDHDAILLDEDGAATPAQGVGIFVNSNGEKTKVTAINSVIDDEEDEMKWLAHRLATMADQKDRKPVISGIVSKILSAMDFTVKTNAETKATEKETDMSKELTDAIASLASKVDGLAANQAAEITKQVESAVKPLLDSNAALIASQKAADQAELDGHVAKIVANNVMTEAVAKELTLNAARELAKDLEPGTAANLNANFNGKKKVENEFADYNINEVAKGDEK